jgi:hypothetical protein
MRMRFFNIIFIALLSCLSIKLGQVMNDMEINCSPYLWCIEWLCRLRTKGDKLLHAWIVYWFEHQLISCSWIYRNIQNLSTVKRRICSFRECHSLTRNHVLFVQLNFQFQYIGKFVNWRAKREQITQSWIVSQVQYSIVPGNILSVDP